MIAQITVFTPTYNRASTLERAFNSLQNQTSKDFEWLVIDDGSTDNTSEIIEKLADRATFTVRYYKKENGGRHTAVNFSHSLIRTPYIVSLDSDDELAPNAVELMINIWNSLDEETYNRVWCVTGREISAETGEMVGKPFPPYINQLRGKEQRKELLKIQAEMHCCRKSEIYKMYKFPEYPDVKYIVETTVWDVINRKYDQYCVNDIFGKYYTNMPDSLAKGRIHKSSRYKSFYYASLHLVNDIFDEFFYNKAVRFYTVNLSRCAMLTNTSYRDVMHDVNRWDKRILVTLGYIPSICWIAYKKIRKQL